MFDKLIKVLTSKSVVEVTEVAAKGALTAMVLWAASKYKISI